MGFHTCSQMLQRQSRYSSEKPPTTGPRTEPPTDEKTTKATAYCWLSDSHISAIIPNVTEPPAEERPPRARPTMTEAKLGARATGSCQILTKSKLNCRIGLRPNSSDQGAQSSQPKAYRTRKIMAPHRPPCSLMPNSLDIPLMALEYRLVLKFMDTWTRKMMERMVHFFHDGKLKPSSS